MKLYRTAYTLRNGTRGVLHVIARSSWDALDTTLAAFGERLRTCSARPA